MSNPHKPAPDIEREVDPEGLGEEQLKENIDQLEEEGPNPYDIDDRTNQDEHPEEVPDSPELRERSS